MIRYNSKTILLAPVAACLLLFPVDVAAELMIKVDDISISSLPDQPVEGFIDVYFEVSGNSPAPLAGYDVVLNLTPDGAGVDLIDVVNPSGTRNPVFPGAAPFDAGSTASRILATAFVNPGSEEMIDNGEGFVRVLFRVGEGITGIFDLNIDLNNTNLSDAGGNAIAFTTSVGTITVIPEPITAMLMLIPASLTLLCRRCCS